MGYAGVCQPAEKIVLDGLKTLEYRGYDSVGLAAISNGKIKVFKTCGRVRLLEGKVPPLSATVAIGHTRWATHGKVCEKNAHPHLSFDKKIAIVHNGVISNADELKAELGKNGVRFCSDTDSELIAHMLTLENCDMKTAIENVGKRLRGATTFLAIDSDENAIYVRKYGASVAIGLGKNENFVASDTLALCKYTQTAIMLKDGECAKVTPFSVEFFKDGKQIFKKTVKVKRTVPGECTCHMRAEIDQIPTAIIGTHDEISKSVDENLAKIIKNAEKIVFCGSGTAYHAGLYGKIAFEKILNIPCDCVVGSEFEQLRFANDKTVGIFITQSGETADTICALKRCKQLGGYTIALTNVESSGITFEADRTLLLNAGAEIAVAATKSYVCQLFALYEIAKICSSSTPDAQDVNRLAACTQNMCSQSLYEDRFKKSNVFFIGKGVDFVTAREGALKFKEITYKMCDAYQSGELKHGTIALVDSKSIVIVIATNQSDRERTKTSVSELRSRGAYVISVSSIGDVGANKTLVLPHMSEDMFYPILSAIPLQTLALTTSLCLGLDPDKPRNLAKSVTVI